MKHDQRIIHDMQNLSRSYDPHQTPSTPQLSLSAPVNHPALSSNSQSFTSKQKRRRLRRGVNTNLESSSTLTWNAQAIALDH